MHGAGNCLQMWRTLLARNSDCERAPMRCTHMQRDEVLSPDDQPVAVAVAAAARGLIERLGDAAPVVVQQPPVQHQLHLTARQ